MIELDIKPHCAQRARTTFKAGKAWTYTPKIYAQYLDDLTLLLKAQKLPQFAGAVELVVQFHANKITFDIHEVRGKPKRGDIDNYLKGLMDGLQKAGVIENDSQVCSIAAVK